MTSILRLIDDVLGMLAMFSSLNGRKNGEKHQIKYSKKKFQFICPKTYLLSERWLDSRDNDTSIRWQAV